MKAEIENSPKYLFLIPETLNHKVNALGLSMGVDSSEFAFAATLTEVDTFYRSFRAPRFLISYSTSVIVPGNYLNNPGQVSVNIHAGSPEYPGRDPHHFAKYEDARVYGATLHYMTEKVDDGQIIDVELFDTGEFMTPVDLLQRADECAWRLMKRLLILIREGQPFPISKFTWSSVKRSRKDFHALCKIDPDIGTDELERRIRAFYNPDFHNLYTEIKGRKFYFIKKDI